MSSSSSKMSVTQLTLLTALNMMGSGIIMLPTKLAEVGTFSILSWLVTAGGSTALAYAFAKCGMLSRNKGGMGGYAEYAFGKSGSFLASWNPNNLPTFDAISASISMTLWAFLGLESACANSEAVENPEKNVPKAVLGATLGVAVIYILSTNIAAGIVDNAELVKSTAPFGLVFSTIFNDTVGKIVMGLMILSCSGSLLSWQFTIARVFKSSADEGYFPKIFSKVTKDDAPVVGMTVIVATQTLMSFMTISPSLYRQFNTLVDLAVVTNVMPYLLSMAAVFVMLKVEGVTGKAASVIKVAALIGTVYSLYALYAAGFSAMMYGALATFAGWFLYGLAAEKLHTVSPMTTKSAFSFKR